jgi:predicted phosphate transport protein (TIGR00153 family)
MFHIIPREEKYFGPFKEMAELINQAARSLVKLFDDIASAETHAESLREIERKCDEIAHDVLKRVNKSFVTPIDREDIFALANALDTIADEIEMAAAGVVMYGLGQSPPAMREMVEALVETAAATSDSVGMLSSTEEMSESLAQIRTLASEGNALYRRAIRGLFAENTDAIGVLRQKEIYEKIVAAIDGCEAASNILEGIALKNS